MVRTTSQPFSVPVERGGSHWRAGLKRLPAVIDRPPVGLWIIRLNLPGSINYRMFFTLYGDYRYNILSFSDIAKFNKSSEEL